MKLEAKHRFLAGGTTFSCAAKGADAHAAFKAARNAALHSHGHDGYTGSIAEKEKFTVVTIDPTLLDDVKAFNEKNRTIDEFKVQRCVGTSWVYRNQTGSLLFLRLG